MSIADDMKTMRDIPDAEIEAGARALCVLAGDNPDMLETRASDGGQNPRWWGWKMQAKVVLGAAAGVK